VRVYGVADGHNAMVEGSAADAIENAIKMLPPAETIVADARRGSAASSRIAVVVTVLVRVAALSRGSACVRTGVDT
jgi:hypothetical protein